MTPKRILTAVTLVALVGASFSTVAKADAGPRGDRMGQLFSFEEMDADSDGKVTKDEITAFHTAKIAAMDTDKDGNLSEAELIAAHELRRAEREATREARMVKRMIEKRDANKDGVLSLEEMAPPAGRGDKMFSRADTDGDGAVSKAEADAMMEKMANRRGDDDDRHQRKGKHGGGHKRGDRNDG